jgi:hypothetical protein
VNPLTTFNDLFERYAAVSLEKQWLLSDIIGDADWQMDLDKGIISFGTEFSFPVQVLGSESYISDTWLWAWANDNLDLSDDLLIAAKNLRELGISEHIYEFTNESVPLQQAQGHQIAMVAAGICESGCYYRGPYEGGAIFVLIDSSVLKEKTVTSAVRMAAVFSQLINLFSLDHLISFNAYLEYKKCKIEREDNIIRGELPNGEIIEGEFDDYKRLTNLQSHI